MVKESLTECFISCNNDLGFVCELFWINLRWLVLVKYSQVLVKRTLIFKSTWVQLRVQVLFKSTSTEYRRVLQIGTRVPKYRSTEYFGPKPDIRHGSNARDERHIRHGKHDRHDRHIRYDRNDSPDRHIRHGSHDRHERHIRHGKHDRDDRHIRHGKHERHDRHIRNGRHFNNGEHDMIDLPVLRSTSISMPTGTHNFNILSSNVSVWIHCRDINETRPRENVQSEQMRSS